MHEHRFWDDYAEATQLAQEGNRLIAQEIAAGLRTLWRRLTRWTDESLRGNGHRPHLPPV